VIRFGWASATLEDESLPTLKELAAVANACPLSRIEIEGHTDAEGTPERNSKLSERRAQAVVGYLTSAGVDASRLTAVGYGATRPVASNDTPESRARNRRIEFKVVPN
jgi:outer membrane protein OmpA-like peptidoglycan-associated protein